MLSQVSKTLNNYISKHICNIFLFRIEKLEFIPPLYGRFLARLIGAIGFDECDSRNHPGARFHGTTAENRDFVKHKEINRTLGIGSTGATSTTVPEADRVWVKIIRLFWEVKGMRIMKWD